MKRKAWSMPALFPGDTLVVHGLCPEEESSDLTEEDIAERVVGYVTGGVRVARLNMCERGELGREEFESEVREYILQTYPVTPEAAERIYERFSRFVWSYYIIDELIDNPDISDIRIIDEAHVYVKRKGKRELSNVRFKDRKDYERFVERVALRNRVNMGNQNAISIFTDNRLSDWILRFNLSTGFVMSGGCPMLHIRKHSRNKKQLYDLVKEGMLPDKICDLITEKIRAGESFLVCGAGSAGKTTLMNGMLEAIPDCHSVFCVQEAEELFSCREREFFGYHIVENRGEGRISYPLESISKNGLMVDADVYIIGEIKGKEARDFLYAVHTGAICYASIHSSSPEDAFIRLADYVKRTSDYSVREILFMLRSLKNCIYLKDYKIQEIAQTEWVEETGRLSFKSIYKGDA